MSRWIGACFHCLRGGLVGTAGRLRAGEPLVSTMRPDPPSGARASLRCRMDGAGSTTGVVGAPDAGPMTRAAPGHLEGQPRPDSCRRPVRLHAGVCGIGIWLPSILKEYHLSTLAIGWISAIPYLFACAGMILWARYASCRHRRFRRAVDDGLVEGVLRLLCRRPHCGGRHHDRGHGCVDVAETGGVEGVTMAGGGA